jgi:hypothetical protein
MGEVNLPNVGKARVFVVECSKCGVVSFNKLPSEADDSIKEHLAEHIAINERIKRVLAQNQAETEALASATGVTLEPILQCPDDMCRVPIGFEHFKTCTVARCMVTGTQRLLIEHIKHLDPADRENHKCGQDVWTGYWPGDKEAAQYGTTRNAVMMYGKWDPEQMQWVMDPDNRPDLK